MKRFIFLPLAAIMGGCTFGLPGLSQRDYVSRSETIPVTAAPASIGSIPVSKVSKEDAAADEARRVAALLLPEMAGRIVKIREKNFSNGTRQEIIIATDKGTYGENVIDVSIRTAEPNARSFSPLTIGPPSENGIRNEILSRFPDVQMNIVTRPMRNALGPFGLAIGRHSGGARCVFTWQWIEDLREAAPGISNVTKLNALMANKGMATSVRIRLCRSDSTVDQLAAHIESLRVGTPAAIERISRMDRRDIESGTTSVSATGATPLLKPVGGSLEAAIAKPVKKEVARAKPAPPPKRVKQAVRREAPPPRERERPPPAPVYAPPPAAAPMPQPYGQRYLAPVAGGAPAPSYGAAAGGAPVNRPGSAGLPPQAYRGPGYPVR